MALLIRQLGHLRVDGEMQMNDGAGKQKRRWTDMDSIVCMCDIRIRAKRYCNTFTYQMLKKYLQPIIHVTKMN